MKVYTYDLPEWCRRALHIIEQVDQSIRYYHGMPRYLTGINDFENFVTGCKNEYLNGT